MGSGLRIAILAKGANQYGDLFTRLVSHMFLGLGYEDFRFNIHKTGREIDVEGRHRKEKRRLVAECKATAEAVGGDAINKFVGVLDMERSRSEKGEAVAGYFVSLSGFTETAREQEKEAGGGRVILIDGERLVDELAKGKVLISMDGAKGRARGHPKVMEAGLEVEERADLLGHEMGWVWAVYLGRNKERTHFALVHADGEPLGKKRAAEIVEADKGCGGELYGLEYLGPWEEGGVGGEEMAEARRVYFEYLLTECGEIQLEGLPADEQVGARRLNLEQLFVPLHLRRWAAEAEGKEGEGRGKAKESERERVGEVLGKEGQLAILADPGGGKSTLIKRLAVAYAYPERRGGVGDRLPEMDVFPVLIRCRQLGEMAKRPMGEVLRAIAGWAEMTKEEGAFEAAVIGALRDGRAMLLIDGLDEIAEDGARQAFVGQMRVLLGRYPGTRVVVTSREAGFRAVAGVLGAICVRYRIAEFDDEDIKRLTLAWHKEVVGDKAEVREEAERLGEAICGTDRVKQLARNPLLLTTLLLVKRWVGQLPTRRSVLYGKAIEVLLMTWNVQGHEALDAEEVVPQLAFVAFAMLKGGEQRISQKRLRELLQLARKQMPEVLGYARVGVNDFVDRVELRSSLLIRSGSEVVDGQLCGVYEFRHLTFQEYLAAKAVVEGYYPERKDGDTIESVMEPFLGKERWAEVVPLVAVLAGRRAAGLVGRLVEMAKEAGGDRVVEGKGDPVLLLGQCILDEAQVPPGMLEEAFEAIGAVDFRHVGEILLAELARGRYGEVLEQTLRRMYEGRRDGLDQVGTALATVTIVRWGHDPWDFAPKEVIKRARKMLSDGRAIERAVGCLVGMHVGWACGIGKGAKAEREEVAELRGEMLRLIGDGEVSVHFAACLATAWMGEAGALKAEDARRAMPNLIEVWRGSEIEEVRGMAAWAISGLPVWDRGEGLGVEVDEELVEFIRRSETAKGRWEYDHRAGALVLAYYAKRPWTDEELAERIAGKNESRLSWRSQLLAGLGEAGERELRKMRERKKG